jgi:SAM-dependent methyltransferase
LSYTELTREWLERRFRVDDGAVYTAHQPIYGIGAGNSEPDHLWRAAKTLQLMRVLSRLRFRSMLDVGAAEGYTAALARDLFSAEAVCCDVSVQAMHRSSEIFGLPSVAANASNLPFSDDAFDVVLSAECIEHLEHPFELLLEAARVASKAVVIATTESRSSYWAARLGQLALPLGELHGHRSVWCPEDFEAFFGPTARASSQHLPRPWPEAEARAVLKAVAAPPPPAHLGEGIVVHVLFESGLERDAPSVDDEALIERILSYRLEAAPHGPRAKDATVAPGVLSALRCPACRLGQLQQSSDGLRCRGCARVFAVEGGVPDLFVAQPAPLSTPVAAHKLDPGVRPARLRWAAMRARQFDSSARVTSPPALRRLERAIRFVECFEAEPGTAAKALFLWKKVERYSMSPISRFRSRSAR